MRKNSSAYPVEVVADAFGESPALAGLVREDARIFLVADQNVVHRTTGLGSRIGHYMQDHGLTLAASPLVVTAGEKAKADDFKTAFALISALVDAKVGRDDRVLAIGGGSLLDLAGYAAAQVRGGIGIIRMPTTPAAMLDAAFADYAALDSPAVKDALRVPSVPEAVVVDLAFCATVLDGVWHSGMGEAVRLALASDKAALKRLEALAPDYARRDESALKDVVALVHALRAKKGATSLALWSAHRIEAMSDYKVPHGYAVSVGILVELAAARAAGRIDGDDMERVVSLLKAGGATETLAHSRQLLQQSESLLRGIDAWMLTAPDGVTMLRGLGKSETAEAPDREMYREAAQIVCREVLPTL